ncbi:hypothetical protein GCM10018779_31100 [Streptomyces griseocarneus]|nr:hypothetical protein GCM10018779_31100 [Streptomyces griseocarneus]
MPGAVAVRRMIREVPGTGAIAAVCCRVHDYADPGGSQIACNGEEARNQLLDTLVASSPVF